MGKKYEVGLKYAIYSEDDFFSEDTKFSAWTENGNLVGRLQLQFRRDDEAWNG
jgi:hypothetical protein